jgi:hypothetical protein
MSVREAGKDCYVRLPFNWGMFLHFGGYCYTHLFSGHKARVMTGVKDLVDQPCMLRHIQSFALECENIALIGCSVVEMLGKTPLYLPEQ